MRGVADELALLFESALDRSHSPTGHEETANSSQCKCHEPDGDQYEDETMDRFANHIQRLCGLNDANNLSRSNYGDANHPHVGVRPLDSRGARLPLPSNLPDLFGRNKA